MKTILVLGIIALPLLSACVPYPILKKLQPATEVSVQDEKGVPIIGAKVILTVMKQPHRRFAVLEVKETDGKGKAEFQTRGNGASRVL